MIKIGEFNKLKVERKKEYGYFLSESIDDKKEDVLLPIKNILDKDKINIGDDIEVFIYRDSQHRLVATQFKPKAVAGEIAFLEVKDNTEIGTFVDIGLERDVLVPFREKKYPIFEEQVYPFYIYVDKSNRLAATTDIEPYLKENSDFNLDDKCQGYVYGFQTNGTAKVVIKPNVSGIILKNEYYHTLKEGDFLDYLRVIKIYDDGKVGLTTREKRTDEINSLEKRILSYIDGNDGFMRFNDKSDPEEIRIVFNTSKKNFKRTLGTMMKKNIIKQNDEGTWKI